MADTKTAIVFNKESGFSREMTATEFERLYAGNDKLNIAAKHPEQREHLQAVSKDGIPVHFSSSYKMAGRSSVIAAHWVREKGRAHNDHVFARNDDKKMPTLKRAVEEGKTVLLSLNLDLSSRGLSFKTMQERGAQRMTDWVAQNHGRYISVPVSSVQDAMKTLKTAHEYGAVLRDRVFAHYEGTVVPYRNFYLGDKREHMLALYNNLQQGTSGVSIGHTRMVGFPRLICFVPGDTTIDPSIRESSRDFDKELRGNHINRETGKPYYNHLVFTNYQEVLEADPYRILRDDLTHGQAKYVLATPSVTVGENVFAQMRWEIIDIDKQTMSIDEAGQQELAKQIKAKGYNSRLFAKQHNGAARDQNNDPDTLEAG